MRTVHIVRKYDLAEWGGTEMAVERLLHGLADAEVNSVLYCPSLNGATHSRVPPGNGFAVKHFHTCVPVWGLTPEAKRQFVSLGGNLFSFDLLPALWREKEFDLVHTHTLGRLGAMGAVAARRRRVPFVVTIHGGFRDLPAPMKKEFSTPQQVGFDWGRLFGFLLRSRQMLHAADALLTCNPCEAALLRQEFPNTRVEVQPHGIPVTRYQQDNRAAVRDAWPELANHEILLCVGRIDPVKNQTWLVEQLPQIISKHPRVLLVLAGPFTDDAYAVAIKKSVADLGLEHHVLFTGGLPPGDPRLIGLFQSAVAVLLPSISETFGLVLLEAWAAGTTVVSSRTSGAQALIEENENGWLFDLENPATFHQAVNAALHQPDLRLRLAAAGNARVAADFDVPAIAARVRQLYHQLIEAKSCDT